VSKSAIVVIGAGVIGRKHAEIIQRSPFFILTGIAEPTENGKNYAKDLGVPWYADAADLLDAVEPDAAIIATPNETHREMALACIERSIPAILEKPIAGSLDDAAAIVAASERAGIPVLVGHHKSWFASLMRETLTCERADPYVEQLNHLHRVIRHEESPLIPAADGALALRATLAVHEAARTAQTVTME
jgi:predicted dehydrogenase